MPTEHKEAELIGLLSMFLALAWIFTGLRVYVRLALKTNWGADDTLLLTALASFTGYAAVGFAAIAHGTGRHLSDIEMSDIPKGLYYYWLGELIYTVTTLLLRFSIAVLILRLCVTRTTRIIVYVDMAAILIFSVFYFFLCLFQCSPVNYFWDQFAGAKGSCIPVNVFPNASIAHSAVSAASDWVLGALPIAIVWDLNMNIRTKVSVAVILSLGMLAGIAALIRIPFIINLSISEDFLFAATDVAIWSTVEPGLGIIATAACVLRPLFQKFYDITISRRTKQSSNPTPSPWASERNGYVRSNAYAGNRHQQAGGDVEISRGKEGGFANDIELEHKGSKITTTSVGGITRNWSTEGHRRGDSTAGSTENLRPDLGIIDDTDGVDWGYGRVGGIKVQQSVQIMRS